MGFFVKFAIVKRNFLVSLLFLSAAAAGFLPQGCRRRAAEATAETAAPAAGKGSIPPMGFEPDSLDMFEGTVRSGEIFTELMARLGMSTADALALARGCDSVFDVRKMRAGNQFHAYYSTDTTILRTDSTSAFNRLEYVVYHVDKIDMIVFRCTPPLEAWTFSKPVDNVLRTVDVTITSSLWNDMTKAGSSPLLVLSLSEIYAWTVDFFGLQEGDRFRVLYDQRTVDGDVIDIDTVYYAEFRRDSLVLPAILYNQGDGGNLYWNERGESLRKEFLKAPLKFTRISSGFSYHRKHPITGQVRPHTAVDYAAPTGTPVMSIGDGTVVSAGWGGGGGNTVKIRHNSVYTTAYLHLSRYAKDVRAGTRVRQGDIIGYVGATGSATGPHLDFRVWKNGSPVNPLKLESPPADPIRPENRSALDSVFRRYRHLADSLTKDRYVQN